MAEVAKVLEFASARAPARHKAEWHARSEPARLIPGSSAATWHGAFRGYGYPQPDGFLASAWMKLIETVLRPLQLIHPSELGVALSDLAIMAILLMCVERMSRMALGFLGFYLLLFVVSAAETGLYRKRHHSLTAQILALANALLWTAILAYLMGTRIPGSLGLASLSVVTFASTCSLSLTRLVWKTLKISPGSARNVLVIADSRIARKVLDKLQSGFDSDICVKAFFASALP